MAKIHHIENFIHWLTHEGKLVEILDSGSTEIPVVAESLDEYNWPYYKYAFVGEDQAPSSGVIKGKAIPQGVLHDGKIKNEAKVRVADFVEGFGVSKEVAARVLAELEDPKSYCFCAKSIRDGTPTACCVTYNTNFHGDTIMWIRETVDTEPDDLVPVDWDEIKGHLPSFEKLKTAVGMRTVGHLTYNPQTQEWDG